MEKVRLKEIVISQQTLQYKEILIDREISKNLDSYIKTPFIIIISGIRRTGKSTLLYQIKQKYPGYYLNFDDERLVEFKLEDFQMLDEIFLEVYGEKKYYYFDEMQNISGWERFVRRIHDEGKKVFITGSNASMLSRELGTHLTGRYLAITLYPFSFKEFLDFKNIKFENNDFYLTAGKIKLKKYFEEYLITGGFPEYLKTKNTEYLKTLYENILYRDIIVRYKLTNEKALKELVYIAANNISNDISFNSIKKTLQLGSSTTVKDYFDFFENSYLIFLINKFYFSLKKQTYSSKKLYIIDTALAINLGFRISKDIGRLLENLIFIELKRRRKEIYYYSDKRECDFVIKNGTKITEVFQSCYELNEDNKKREIEGLLEAMTKFRLKEGIILTLDQKEDIIMDKKKIKIIPVWEYLLSK